MTDDYQPAFPDEAERRLAANLRILREGRGISQMKLAQEMAAHSSPNSGRSRAAKEEPQAPHRGTPGSRWLAPGMKERSSTPPAGLAGPDGLHPGPVDTSGRADGRHGGAHSEWPLGERKA